jgi:salicylate hydroxylase
MRATVIGGGVAGSASAIALRRIGADVTVYEAYEDPAGTVGSFVSLAANGLRAVAALGVLAEVQQAGFAVARQRMWSSGGKLLGDVPRGRRDSDPLLSVTLWRRDLVQILRDAAARSGVRIITGHRVRDLGAGSAAADADVVVGADGIWSQCRRALAPAGPEPAYASLYSISGTSVGLDLPPGTFNMIFGRHGTFIYLPAPDHSVWWSAQVAASEPPDLTAVGIDDLRRLFATETQATTILQATTTLSGRTLNHVLGAVPRRHDERLVLVGDAAHPVGAGQGASMALEDAVVLGRELDREATVMAALAGFDQARSRRLGQLVKAASANRDAKTAGPIAARLRNLVMPIVFSRVYPRATGWLYDYEVGELPELGVRVRHASGRSGGGPG